MTNAATTTRPVGTVPADPFAAFDQFDTDAPFVPVQAVAPAVETIDAPAPVVRCTECHRPLRSAASIARQAGRTCATKRTARITAAAATVDAKPASVDKALDLIADGGIVALRRLTFRAVSSDGTRRYLTSPTACNCTAGLYGRECCHRTAARILTAA